MCGLFFHRIFGYPLARGQALPVQLTINTATMSCGCGAVFALSSGGADSSLFGIHSIAVRDGRPTTVLDIP
jgi:hypothetical protein